MPPPFRGWAFVDLHCHTPGSFDSCRTRPTCRAAAARGLTHLAITDHDRIDGALRARDAAPDGLTSSSARRSRPLDGDLIALFLERAVPPGLSAAETIAGGPGPGRPRRDPAPVRPVPRLDAQRPEAARRSARWSTGSRRTTPGSSAARATSGRWRSRSSMGLPGVAVSATRTACSRSASRTRRSTAIRRRPEGLLAALRRRRARPGAGVVYRPHLDARRQARQARPGQRARRHAARRRQPGAGRDDEPE